MLKIKYIQEICFLEISYLLEVFDMDKELIVMEEIYTSNNISQRQLSQMLGISLGTVNSLLKKMKNDGLIKVKQIPTRRVCYMLTPKGLAEKAKKTYNYVKIHYRYIDEMRNRIRGYILSRESLDNNIYFIIGDNSIYDIVEGIINEFESIRASLVKNINEIDEYVEGSIVIFETCESIVEISKCKCISIIDIME